MPDKDLFFVEENNPKMIEAFKNAQKTFKYFWRELSWEYRRIIPALTIACVKVAFSQETEEGPIVEHMWINDIHFDGNLVQGNLINSPNELTNVQLGEQVTVPLNKISDWLFATYSAEKPKKGLSKFLSSKAKPKTFGGFTIQTMRSEMTDQERKAHDNAWGLDFGDFNEILVVTEQHKNPENLIEHPMSKNMREKLRELLKENPSEISYQDEHGLTLLHKEAIAGNLTSIEVLLSVGADKSIKSKTGETALDFAQKMNWEHIIPILSK